MFRRFWMLSLCLFLGPRPSEAGEPLNLAVRPGKLATIITTLYGSDGLVVDSLATLETGATHSAHFNSAFQSEFTQFSTLLTSQLAAAPLPSPASGFTYEFDASLGVFVRSTQSFGPILAERAETIGGKRFSIGFSFQRFSFDTIEGRDLGRLPAVFTHDGAELRGGREDVVTTMNSIRARLSQFNTFLTYGLTDRLDISVAVPIVSADLQVISDATIQRVGTEDQSIHFFREAKDNVGQRRIFTAFGSASGLGDITVRLKGNVSRRQGVSLGLDLRVPTGDEMELLGVGAAAAKPFVIWSSSWGAFSPHVNAGYEWNGSSVLAGNPVTGAREDLPDRAFYVAGADLGVGSRFTFAFELMGNWLFDAPRMKTVDFHALDGVSVFPNMGFETDSYQILNGAVGVKLNIFEHVLVDFNLLFNINDNGLQDKVTPLIGLEYGF